jgi:hypothetical protein
MGTPPDPELLALRALGFLAETPEDLVRFLSMSGATPDDLRTQAEDPQFLCGVLDFLLSDDDMVRHFCAAEAIDPQTLHLARNRLTRSGAN